MRPRLSLRLGDSNEFGACTVWRRSKIFATLDRPARAIRCAQGVIEVVLPLAAMEYAWNGDVSLAYQVVGEGPIDLLYIPGGLSNIEVMWESRRYAHFLERLVSFARLIVKDRRGCGCSERRPQSLAPLPGGDRNGLIKPVIEAAGPR